MDIRAMQYFLAVVREGTISAAAKALHVAQPSLSRQMRDLEEELDATLFVRGNRRIALTEEGAVLRKRAEEMLRLLQMTETEIMQVKTHVSGSVNIGAGESLSFHYLSRAAATIAEKHPDIRFHITSGDTRDLMDELDNGLIDLAVIFTDVDHTVYQSIDLPARDRFGLLMPKNSPLAEREEIRLSDLEGAPLIVPRAAEQYLSHSEAMLELNVVATYNLVYNASLLVEDGLGYAVCFDGLVNTTGNSRLCTRPIIPQMENAGHLIWKRHQLVSPVVQAFLDCVRDAAGQ